MTAALQSFPRTPFLVPNTTVAKFLDISDDDVKGLHKLTVLGRYISNKQGKGFEVLKGVGRWNKQLACGKTVRPWANFFSFGHKKTPYNTAASMDILLDLVDGT